MELREDAEGFIALLELREDENKLKRNIER